jgi:hypothetical protein
MPRFALVVFAAVVVCSSTAARGQAQDATPEPSRAAATSFPGSAWVNSGYVSPLEPGNLLTTYAFEQGVTLWKEGAQTLVPYGALTVTLDEEGLDWNNKALSQVGLRYSRAFGNGVVQAGAGYAYERRFRSSQAVGQPIGFASYWFGWNPPVRGTGAGRLWSSLPGTSWAAVGNHAPAEGNNVIATVYVQQGLTVATIGNTPVIPFLEHTLTVDAAGHPWNNRSVLGEGLKLRVPIGGAVLETAAIYKHERRWHDGSSASGMTASVNLWYGWNPAGSRSEK